MTGDARPTTIKEVAAELGVSIATVSRALARPALLSAETRARVLEGIERLGYRPNLLARDLRTRESKVAFVVVPSLSPFFLEVFRGVEKAARKIGYSVLMGHTDRDQDREHAFLDQVAARRADGIILVTSSHAPAIVQRKRLPPVVAALEQIDGCTLPAVRVDHTAAAVTATRHLLDLGHERIAHISGPMRSPMAVHRLAGFEQAIGDKLDRSLCVEGDFTVRSGELAMNLLLGRERPPTAVFAANDEMAICAVRAAKAAGLRLPEDISVIGFDDQRLAGLYDPPLTTVHVPTAEIGYRSMLLLERVLSNSAADQDIVLPTKIVSRATTGPRLAGDLRTGAEA
jgi:LacI family transcriptional regulator, repressor for deo operon, udp, cdd, tsx, nupC, and nupG